MRRSENIQVLGMMEEKPELGDRLRAVLDDPAIAAPREALLAFIRASVIADDYHMDPLWMLELMEGEWFVKQIEREQLRAEGKIPAIPLDWRHPGAHGLYWAALGVKRAHGLLRPGDFDVLNTDRQVIHSMQLLTESGQTSYTSNITDNIPGTAYRFAIAAQDCTPNLSTMVTADITLSPAGAP